MNQFILGAVGVLLALAIGSGIYAHTLGKRLTLEKARVETLETALSASTAARKSAEASAARLQKANAALARQNAQKKADLATATAKNPEWTAAPLPPEVADALR